jgi:hypothetical protein
VRWFQDMEIPNLVTDTIANEVTTDPNNGIALPLHCALMHKEGEPGERLTREPPGHKMTTYTERPWAHLYGPG